MPNSCGFGDRCPKCHDERVRKKELLRGFSGFLIWIIAEASAQEELSREYYRGAEQEILATTKEVRWTRIKEIRESVFLKLIEKGYLKIEWGK